MYKSKCEIQDYIFFFFIIPFPMACFIKNKSSIVVDATVIHGEGWLVGFCLISMMLPSPSMIPAI